MPHKQYVLGDVIPQAALCSLLGMVSFNDSEAAESDASKPAARLSQSELKKTQKLGTGAHQCRFTSARRSSAVGLIVGRMANKRLDSDSRNVAHSFDETLRADEQRRRLLEATRGISPEWVAFRFDRIASSFLPSLLMSPSIWLSNIAFGVGVLLARTDSIEYKTRGDALQGSSVLITFMLTFYFGYCYNRHYSQYAEAMKAADNVVAVCAKARMYLPSASDNERIWRFVNLAHVAGYVGLSTVCALCARSRSSRPQWVLLRPYSLRRYLSLQPSPSSSAIIDCTKASWLAPSPSQIPTKISSSTLPRPRVCWCHRTSSTCCALLTWTTQAAGRTRSASSGRCGS